LREASPKKWWYSHNCFRLAGWNASKGRVVDDMLSGKDRALELGQLRQNFDLLLRAQQFGRTGYIISDVARDRVYWSASLFEQRKVPFRKYFTREEAMEFIHPEDRDAFRKKRDQAVIDRREFELEMRIVCGDG
jgi:hypothetical protein